MRNEEKNMRKKITTKSVLFLALVAIAAVLALSACGSKNNNDSASSSPSASPSASASSSASASASASAPAAGGKTDEITITATNFQYDKQEIKVHKGDTVKITLKNDSGNHGFQIKDYNVNIKGGETATFVADKAGSFDYNCSIQCGSGHDNMTGTLTVE
jgi:cytochrome c oxidase subunit 2